MFNNCPDGRSFHSFSNNLEDFDSIRSVLLYRFVGFYLFMSNYGFKPNFFINITKSQIYLEVLAFIITSYLF